MLPAHDRFLTVDLYDNKDPAQVLQCIGAFSRAANEAKPSVVRTAIGPKRASASPTRRLNGDSSTSARSRTFSNASGGSDRTRAMSPALTGGSNTSSSTKTSNQHVSSWSKKDDEFKSAPAWNIHQYGYMGGASQGNQGISFGSRRQITSPRVNVPSVAEKEKRRKEQEAEEERLRKEEERQTRLREQQQWEEETRKKRDMERQQLDEERKRWEEDERRWKRDEERRKREQEEEDARLRQYQADLKHDAEKSNADNDRIRELERQLEEAKERERQYQLERDGRQANRTPDTPEQPDTYRRPDAVSTPTKDLNRDSWAPDERAQLRQAWKNNQTAAGSPAEQSLGSSRPLPNPETASSLQATPQNMRPGGPLAPPTGQTQPVAPPSASAEPLGTDHSPRPTTRPLPDPSAAQHKATYSSPIPANGSTPRTERFLATNPAPSTPSPRTNFPREMGMTSESERSAEDSRRVQSQQKTKAGGWASKSLLEREMERERERQREWEEQQISKRGGSGLMGPRELKR